MRLKIIIPLLVFTFCSYFNVFAQDNTKNINSIINEGPIQNKDYISFNKEINSLGIKYITKYLPENSYQYNKKVYTLIPNSIWWHWDAGSNPSKINDGSKRVLSTYDILKQRTDKGEPVSTNFSIGPNVVLQMLPLSKTNITQGRLSNDLKIEDITKSQSLGGIQIETTGTLYDKTPPLTSQTETLIKMTSILMKQYNIPFSKIYGHLEKSANISKIDPGIIYLKKTRIQLLKYLIKNKQIENIDKVENWNFYTEKLVDGNIVNVLDQSSSEIYNSLTKKEKEYISKIK